MILRFFDYIYYRTYSAYKDWDNMPYMYAICLVALLQQFNVGIIAVIVYVFSDLNAEVNKYVLFASYFVFLIPNYNRYTWFANYRQMHKKWGEDKKRKKVLGGVAVIFYIVMSIVLFFVAATTFGKIMRGEL
ncbi:MAG: hypothetical protein JXP36_15090 [Bacteroidales bacterium]|nr:hypothetical protein [Bacteroidales bacterium]